MAFVFYTILSFCSYLLLTAGSGSFILIWSLEEIAVALAVSLFIAFLSWRFVPSTVTAQIANPFRWFAFLIYLLIPFLIGLVYANIEVTYRVITGRIKPAIVKLDTDFKGSLGTFFLANSITLSPGTLSIELDESNDSHSIYVHCLSWQKSTGKGFAPKEVAPFIYYWLRKIF